MFFSIIAVPFIASIVMLIFFRRKMAFWEYGALFAVSFAISFFMQFLMCKSNTSDIEYLGYYVTTTTKYEEWNERVRVRKTRSKTVSAGKGKTRVVTETYYVWETHNHPEYYTFTDNANKEHNCAKAVHIKIKNTFGTSEIFRDMKRHYHTKDGDAYDWKWSGDFEKIYPYTVEDYYTNPLKSSRSILWEYDKVTPEIIEEYGLFDYPVVHKTYQPTVLGIKRPDTKYIDNMNALLGKDYQFRLFMCFFKNKGLDAYEYQKAYWQNGNKNELVLCIGFDNNNKVQWCEGFTWCDTPILEAKCKQYFLTHPDIDLKAFSEWLMPLVKTDWRRKDFSDYDYVTTDLSDWQYFWILIITIIANVGCCWMFVINEYDAPEERK